MCKLCAMQRCKVNEQSIMRQRLAAKATRAPIAPPVSSNDRIMFGGIEFDLIPAPGPEPGAGGKRTRALQRVSRPSQVREAS